MSRPALELDALAVAPALARLARGAGAAVAAAVRSVPGGGVEAIIVHPDGADAIDRAWEPLAAPPRAVSDALAGRATFAAGGADADWLGTPGGAAWAVVPAHARGVSAALALAWQAPRRFDADARSRLLLAARPLARALEADRDGASLVETLVDEASIALAVLDHRLRIVLANAALEQVAGGPVPLGAHLADGLPTLPSSLEHDLRAVIAGEAARTVDVAELATEGAPPRHWLATCFAVRHDMAAAHAGLALVEVTERVALEDERARRYRLERRARRERDQLLAVERSARARLVASERRRTQRIRLADRLARCRTQAAVARVVLSEVGRALGPSGVWIWRHDGAALVALATTYGADMRERYGRVPIDADLPLVEAVTDGRPVFLARAEEWARWPDLARDAAERGLGTTASLPLVVAGAAIGALTVDFPSDRALDEDERAFLVVLASQAAQALDRARSVDDVARHAAALERALAEARAAEARAEREAGRLDALRLLAEALADATTPEEVAHATPDALPTVVGRPIHGALLVGSSPSALRVVGGGADRALSALAARAARSGGPAGVGGATAVPLAGSSLLGVLAVRGLRLADRAGLVPLVVVAGQAAAALDRQRLRVEEVRAAARLAAVSRRFQASLVPAPQVHVRGVRVSAHYAAGDERMELGGDVVDACDAPGGGVAFLIGDVAGHGPEAAALGSVLRAAWRGIVLDDADPAAALARLDRVLASERRGDDAFATAITGLLRADAGSLILAVAGHPSPILVEDGSARPLTTTQGPPLGVVGRGRWSATDEHLARGATLVAYTDGLTEARARPGRVERYGERRLVRALGRLDRAGPIDDAALAALVADVRRRAGGAIDDDVAMLAIARQPPEPR